MSTTPINNKPSDLNGNGKKWNRASLLAAVATGALTVEAANLLLHRDEPDAEPLTESEIAESVSPDSEASVNIEDGHPSAHDSDSTIDHYDEPVVELTPEPIPEPQPEPIPEPEPVAETEPEPIPEPIGAADEDIVDVIVQEIDPQDIDMEDVLLVDEIGTVYTVDGGELQAALIHDANGNQAVMVDIDGDNVYDVIATPEGEIIAQVQGDVDTSDVELLYAQQHDDSGYMEPNDFDVAMNQEHPDIQDDISLT